MRVLIRTVLSLGLAAVCLAAAGVQASERAPVDEESVAVIVNPKNPTTNLTFRQLRSYLKLEQQFWPDKDRVELFLRPSRSSEMAVLLSEVYSMSRDELRKYWVGKVFRGDIPSKPAVIPTAKAAGIRVNKLENAITIVLASEVPDGVRVLTIDNKKPGDEGYPLVVRERSALARGR